MFTAAPEQQDAATRFLIEVVPHSLSLSGVTSATDLPSFAPAGMKWSALGEARRGRARCSKAQQQFMLRLVPAAHHHGHRAAHSAAAHAEPGYGGGPHVIARDGAAGGRALREHRNGRCDAGADGKSCNKAGTNRHDATPIPKEDCNKTSERLSLPVVNCRQVRAKSFARSNNPVAPLQWLPHRLRFWASTVRLRGEPGAGAAATWTSAAALHLNSDLVSQLLLSRGVASDDIERHRNPSLRAFLPDPSLFRDMDAAAERLAQAVLTGETVTIYGDYDVDGATSAALLVRLLRALGHEARYYIPDRLLEGYGPSGEALV